VSSAAVLPPPPPPPTCTCSMSRGNSPKLGQGMMLGVWKAQAAVVGAMGRGNKCLGVSSGWCYGRRQQVLRCEQWLVLWEEAAGA
jgi:hypothetical protein